MHFFLFLSLNSKTVPLLTSQRKKTTNFEVGEDSWVKLLESI